MHIVKEEVDPLGAELSVHNYRCQGTTTHQYASPQSAHKTMFTCCILSQNLGDIQCIRVPKGKYKFSISMVTRLLSRGKGYFGVLNLLVASESGKN